MLYIKNNNMAAGYSRDFPLILSSYSWSPQMGEQARWDICFQWFLRHPGLHPFTSTNTFGNNHRWLGGAYISCFPLDCKPHQYMLTVSLRWSPQNQKKKKGCYSQLPKADTHPSYICTNSGFFHTSEGTFHIPMNRQWCFESTYLSPCPFLIPWYPGHTAPEPSVSPCMWWVYRGADLFTGFAPLSARQCGFSTS